MSKRWEEHSPSWRSKHAANGETAARWNAWLTLSPSAKKASSQAEYAAGKSVPEQRRESLTKAAYEAIRNAVTSPDFRPATVRRGVRSMTNEHLHWTIDASSAQIRARARKKTVKGYERNPWWYR